MAKYIVESWKQFRQRDQQFVVDFADEGWVSLDVKLLTSIGVFSCRISEWQIGAVRHFGISHDGLLERPLEDCGTEICFNWQG